MTLFQLEDVKKEFTIGDKKEEVLKGIDLSLRASEITALTGTSGSGKSTLLTIAACLQPLTNGVIHFQGQQMNALSDDALRSIRAKHFGFVFQFAHLVPFLTVTEQLETMLTIAQDKRSLKAQQQAIHEMLEAVGLTHRKDAYPPSLSGGEKQRVAIARALIHRPTILFADEPTASLDTSRSHDVMQLIQQLTKSLKIATLLVTHDEEMLAYADHVIEMRDGNIQQVIERGIS